MKRKLLAMGLTLSITAGMLAGCGSAGTASGTSAQSTASSSGAAATDASVTKTSVGEYTEGNPYELTFAYIEF